MSKHSERKEARKEQTYIRRLRDTGVEIVDAGNVLDAPDDALLTFYSLAKQKFGKHGRKGMQMMFAAEINRRGLLRGCGCPTCTTIRDEALAWEAYCKELGVDPRPRVES